MDAEHTGIRTAGCGVFAAALILSYLLLTLLLPDAFVVAGLGSLVAATLVSHAVDARLRVLWPSGRAFYADSHTIQITRRGQPEAALDAGKQINVLPWRFEVKRTGRVRKGWYVVALALEQDDTMLALYTFASPQQFDAMPLKAAFEVLQPTDKVAKGRDMRLAGQQRRLHTAEKIRELHGAELTLPEFTQMLTFLQEQYPSWMPAR